MAGPQSEVEGESDDGDVSDPLELAVLEDGFEFSGEDQADEEDDAERDESLGAVVPVLAVKSEPVLPRLQERMLREKEGKVHGDSEREYGKIESGIVALWHG